MPETDQDWGAVLARVLEGDRRALLRVAGLVNSFLARWNAYDFRDEWDDLVQEVVAAGAIAVRDGKLRKSRAALGFLYSTARFKYVDRLRRQLRLAEGQALVWSAPSEPIPNPQTQEARQDLERALTRISDKTRVALVAVYIDGHTYDEAASVTGIPLGTLKRCLRDGLLELRAALGEGARKR